MKDELLKVLRRRANHRGQVLIRESVLLEKLTSSKDELQSALQALAEDGTIAILSPLPFLAIRLHSWSRSNPRHVQMKQQISTENRSPKEVPVSSSIAAAVSSNRDRGAGEGVNLLDEVLAVLGPEADREEFRWILKALNPSLIHRALKRVQQTRDIRVSKPALFRALLRKLSH